MPTQGDLYVAPFTDELLYMEQMNKVQFWQQKSFYSVDLSPLREAAHLEYLSQPIKVSMVCLYVYNTLCYLHTQTGHRLLRIGKMNVYMAFYSETKIRTLA